MPKWWAISCTTVIRTSSTTSLARVAHPQRRAAEDRDPVGAAPRRTSASRSVSGMPSYRPSSSGSSAAVRPRRTPRRCPSRWASSAGIASSASADQLLELLGRHGSTGPVSSVSVPLWRKPEASPMLVARSPTGVWPSSSSGPGRRPFKAAARVRIPLGARTPQSAVSTGSTEPQCSRGPVAQLVSAPPCHGGGRGFESRQGRPPSHQLGRSGRGVRRWASQALAVQAMLARSAATYGRQRRAMGSRPPPSFAAPVLVAAAATTVSATPVASTPEPEQRREYARDVDMIRQCGHPM